MGEQLQLGFLQASGLFTPGMLPPDSYPFPVWLQWREEQKRPI